MIRTTWLAFALAVVCLGQVDEPARTRTEIFAPITDQVLNPTRQYVELDLNRDGVKDIVISESLSLGGTGGQIYNLYVSTGKDRYQRVEQFLASRLSTEVHDGEVRLWSYTHISAREGRIGYRYFDRERQFRKSASLDIQTGDGGTEMGNDIMQAVFNDRALLKLRTWKKAPAGAVPATDADRP